MREQFKN